MHNQVKNNQLKHRVKIIDLAKSLNLSKGTISRALNDYADISDSTKLRVRKHAKIMGYVPLSSAQAIKTGRVRALGLVLRVDSHDSHHAFLTDFLDGVSRSAGTKNWTLTVATATSDEDELQTFRRLVAERKVDGFIITRCLADDKRIAMLHNAEIPYILYGRTNANFPVSYFDISGEMAIESAVCQLVNLGHKNIGFVNGPVDLHFAQMRQKGYLAGLEKSNLSYNEAYTQSEILTREQGIEATNKLLKLPAPPTAIIFSLDMAALGGYRAVENLGLTVGQDVSIIGYDGISQGKYAMPALSTFEVDTRKAGERLASMLIDQIRGEAITSLNEIQQAKFVSRGSSNPPRITSEKLAKMISGNQ